MVLNGWIFNITESKPLDFAGQCGSSTWYGWSTDTLVGTVSTTFSGNGTATLKFGNCLNTGHVVVILDGKRISYTIENQMWTHTSFKYFVGSILMIQELDNAIIKLYELDLLCDKQVF